MLNEVVSKGCTIEGEFMSGRTLYIFGTSVIRASIFGLLMFSFSANAVAEDNNSKRLDGLPDYQPANLFGLQLTSVGSDAMGGLVNQWVDEYRKYQPKAKIQIVSRGSAMAPAALIEGTADLGPMVRPMRSVERDEFVSRYGFAPTEIRTALAAVALYVHPENPLSAINLEQLESIYSANPQRNGARVMLTWGQLGISTPFAENEILPVGRLDDTYASIFFRQTVLLQAEYSQALMRTAELESLVKSASLNPGTIAFGEFTGAVPQGVKVLDVARSSGEKAKTPTNKSIIDGSYPLSRYLSIYIVREPGEELDASLADFLRFVLSRQGQELVLKQGLLPLPVDVLREELAKLD